MPRAIVCGVCGDLNSGGQTCERCGSPLPHEDAPAPPRAEPAAPPPPAPTTVVAPQASSGTLPQAGTSSGIPAEERSALADLERLEREARTALPSAGSSQGLGGGYAAPSQPTIPTAGFNDQAFTSSSAPAERLKRPRKRSPGPVAILPAGFWYIVKSGFAIAFLLALASGSGLLLLIQHQSKLPKNLVPRLAQRYLTALANTDYATAYFMLSIPAQTRCTIDEYRLMRGPGQWVWGGLKAVRVEPEAVELSYDLQVPGQPKVTTYLFFVKEGDHWRVPYNFNLMKQVEKATQAADPDLAVLDSQEAVRVNPRDPMARAYLCEAAYYRKLYDQARTECAAALKLADKYPSNLDPKSVDHMKSILTKLERGK